MDCVLLLTLLQGPRRESIAVEGAGGSCEGMAYFQNPGWMAADVIRYVFLLCLCLRLCVYPWRRFVALLDEGHPAVSLSSSQSGISVDGAEVLGV